jgi:hypothetical protein
MFAVPIVVASFSDVPASTAYARAEAAICIALQSVPCLQNAPITAGGVANEGVIWQVSRHRWSRHGTIVSLALAPSLLSSSSISAGTEPTIPIQVTLFQQTVASPNDILTRGAISCARPPLVSKNGNSVHEAVPVVTLTAAAPLLPSQSILAVSKLSPNWAFAAFSNAGVARHFVRTSPTADSLRLPRRTN